MNTTTKIINFLQNYNAWRRGDETLEMPPPAEIGTNIQDAIVLLRKNAELEAELATEREKVRGLHKALKNIKNSICRIVPDGYSQPCVDESADECDMIIEAAMKEGAKWPTPEQYEDAAKRVTEMAAHIRAQTKKGGRK